MARRKSVSAASRTALVLTARRDVLLAIEVLTQTTQELRTISSRLRTAAQLIAGEHAK
jgi:hypothetical protein